MLQDALTGLLARASFDEQLASAIENARQSQEPLSLSMLEIDHFKSVNDGFGHARGDQVLIELAQRLRKILRADDLLFRYGGDEFVLIAPRLSKDQSLGVAQRLLDMIVATPFSGNPPITITISIGVATFPQDADRADTLFALADARSYIAKRNGRARVVGEDQVLPTTTRFNPVSRLIERDRALQTTQSFVSLLSEQPRGILGIIGAVGSGRSRFLTEIALIAQMRGYAVLRIGAAVYEPTSAFAQGLRDLLGKPLTLPIPLAQVEQDLQVYLQTHQQRGVMIIADNLNRLDQSSLGLVRALMQSATLPTVALAYAAERNWRQRLALPAVRLHDTVELAPLSASGVRVWLRMAMGWEASSEFIEWLVRETNGLPAALERAVIYLIDQQILVRMADGWVVQENFATLDLDQKLGLRIRATPNNLPEQLTSFIGREEESAAIKQLLTTARLVTLFAAGGVGKTRLSLHVAADSLDLFPDGVWLIELAPLSDPALVPFSIAKVLGVREELGRPLMETLGDWLRAKQLLLILDNCEHLLDACARFADAALRAGSEMRILASSREALDIPGEAVYHVPSLDIPNPKEKISLEQLTQCAAVQLFSDRATLALSTFRVNDANAPAVAEICARLNGIPLAIELAAARVKMLSVEKINERLNARFELLTGGNRVALPRQQTLRALIDWSYNLLSQPERVLFHRLSVFAGGWTLEEAEAICSLSNASGTDALASTDVLDLVTHLVDKSLVVAEEPSADTEARYHMLETIREYAREKLAEAHESEPLRDRHLDFFLDLAKRVEPILGRQRSKWVPRLEADHDNIRAALEWACQRDPDKARWLAGLLHWFWYYADHVGEALVWYARVLDLGEQSKTKARAIALLGAGALYAVYFILDKARRALEESIALWRELDEPRWLSQSLSWLGYAFLLLGQTADACALFEKNESLIRESVDESDLVLALTYWGRAASTVSKNYAAAQRLLESSLTLAQRVQDPEVFGIVYLNLGAVATQQGDYDAALRYHSESLAWRRQAGALYPITISLRNVADAMSLKGEYGQAQPLYDEAIALSRNIGDQIGMGIALYRRGFATLHQAQYDKAELLFVESLEIFNARSDELGVMGCLTGCAELWIMQGQPEPAARLLAFVETFLKSRARVFRLPADRIEYEQSVAAVRMQVEPATLQAAWQAGSQMTIEQAIEYAMEKMI